MLCEWIKVLVSQNSKTDFKSDFVFKRKLFQVASLSCKKGFRFEIKTTSKSCLLFQKPLFKEKEVIPNGINLLYKILVHENVFN